MQKGTLRGAVFEDVNKKLEFSTTILSSYSPSSCTFHCKDSSYATTMQYWMRRVGGQPKPMHNFVFASLRP